MQQGDGAPAALCIDPYGTWMGTVSEALPVAILALLAYLLGAVPAAYLVGKWSRNVDIRRYGSGNVGTSNLLTVTSRKTALPAIFFDLGKGLPFLLIAHFIGLSLGAQAIIAVAPLVGHAWPVYLGFNGGRAVLTMIGVAFTLPIVNGYMPWEFVSFLGFAGLSLLLLRSTPVGVIAGAASFPAVSFATGKPPPITLGFLAIFVVIITRRLVAPRAPEARRVTTGQLLFYRALFDRDIKDGEAWKRRMLP